MLIFELVEEISIELLLLLLLIFVLVPVLIISIFSRLESLLSFTLISRYSFYEKDNVS